MLPDAVDYLAYLGVVADSPSNSFAEHSSHNGETFLRSSEVLPRLDRPTYYCHLSISSLADPDGEHLLGRERDWRTERLDWDLPTKDGRLLVSEA